MYHTSIVISYMLKMCRFMYVLYAIYIYIYSYMYMIYDICNMYVLVRVNCVVGMCGAQGRSSLIWFLRKEGWSQQCQPWIMFDTVDGRILHKLRYYRWVISLLLLEAHHYDWRFIVTSRRDQLLQEFVHQQYGCPIRGEHPKVFKYDKPFLDICYSPT